MCTGYVYLIHFESRINPEFPCQHYIGYTPKDVARRIATHRAGGYDAARICQVAAERDIPFTLVRVWRGDRQLERRLKNRKEAPHLCPICSKHPKPVTYAEEVSTWKPK